MIIRILGMGQYDVPDAEVGGLNELDNQLMAAIDAGDDAGFHAALNALVEKVRSAGSPLADNDLRPSDVVLPDPDTHVDDVRELLGDEGLIPG